MLRRARSVLAVAATGALALVATPSAGAAPGAPSTSSGTPREVLTRGVVGPFNLAVRDGRILVADGFTGMVDRVSDGQVVPVVTDAPGAAGVAWGLDGRSFAYTTTDDSGNAAFVLHRPGRPDVRADLSGYERTHNPDAHKTYGAAPGTNACARQFFRQVNGGPASYPGLLDAHPYSVAALADGTWAVADAGGNDILGITADGAVRTIAVLPAQPHTFTAAEAAALGAPDCVVGTTYRFEAVPTDVEQGPQGRLLVTTLPGGPEGPQLGARGSLYRLTAGGYAEQVATGFAGATNLAVGTGYDAGSVYVTELFAGRVSRVVGGVVTPVVKVAGALGIEADGGDLYVSTLAQTDPTTGQPTAPGKVLRLAR